MLTAAQVDVSFFGNMEKELEECCDDDSEDKPFDGERLSDFLIVDHTADWYKGWKALTTLCSLTSTY